MPTSWPSPWLNFHGVNGSAALGAHYVLAFLSGLLLLRAANLSAERTLAACTVALLSLWDVNCREGDARVCG